MCCKTNLKNQKEQQPESPRPFENSHPEHCEKQYHFKFMFPLKRRKKTSPRHRFPPCGRLRISHTAAPPRHSRRTQGIHKHCEWFREKYCLSIDMQQNVVTHSLRHKHHAHNTCNTAEGKSPRADNLPLEERIVIPTEWRRGFKKVPLRKWREVFLDFRKWERERREMEGGAECVCVNKRAFKRE